MPNSPFRSTAVTVACSAVIVAGFFASDFYPVHKSLPLLIVSFLCVVGGIAGMYWTSFMLREDVRNERWSDEVLAPYRAVTTHVLWYVAMALLAIATLFAWVHNRHHHSPFLWMFLFLLQTQSQLTSAFAKPRKPAGPGHRINWKFSPLRSEHWGER